MRLLILVAVVASISVGLALVVLNLAEIPGSMEEAVARLRSFDGSLWAVGMIIIAGDAFLLLPSDAAILVLGLVYGALVGGALSGIASVSGGMLVFATGRAFANRAPEWLIGERETRRLRAFYERWGVYSVALARAVGGPLEIVPALAGLSRMTWSLALIAMCAGGIPAAFLKAALGSLVERHPVPVLLAAAVLSLGGAAIAHWLVADRGAPNAAR